MAALFLSVALPTAAYASFLFNRGLRGRAELKVAKDKGFRTPHEYFEDRKRLGWDAVDMARELRRDREWVLRASRRWGEIEGRVRRSGKEWEPEFGSGSDHAPDEASQRVDRAVSRRRYRILLMLALYGPAGICGAGLVIWAAANKWQGIAGPLGVFGACVIVVTLLMPIGQWRAKIFPK